MNRFYTWAALIAAIGYLILLGFFYSLHPRSMAEYIQKDPVQILGALLAVVAINRMFSRLTADRGQPRNLDSLPAEPTQTLSDNERTAKPPLSFGAAMRKKPGTLAFLCVCAFALPPLMRLSKPPAVGTPFTREFWHSVAIGELLMAAALIGGWLIAKRKYERNLRR
jgi:hypothetical protein